MTLKKGVCFLVILVVLTLSWLKVEDLLIRQSKSVVDEQVWLVQGNQDVYAHIKVAGTVIDYSIAQHPTDDGFYLRHDVKGQASIYGAIFTEKLNKKEFKDLVTIVYGHSTYDGSMFGSLPRFLEATFFKEHQNIVITTRYERISYEIFAAYSYTDAYLFETFNLGNQASVSAYIKTLKGLSDSLGGQYRQVPYGENDRMLMLSTCDTRDNNRRVIVHAKETSRELLDDTVASR
mgnify:CR=1 FL=1